MLEGRPPRETGETRETAEQATSDSDEIHVEVRRHAGGFAADAYDARGRHLGVLEAERHGPDAARLTRFAVDARFIEPAGRRMLEAARQVPGNLDFRWRKRGTGGLDPGRVELLREGETADQFWRERREIGPSDHFRAEDAEARATYAEFAAREIADLTGERAPDLRERVRFLGDEAFERELMSHGDSAAEARSTLGVYHPDTGEILVRDSAEAWRQGALVHEGLHAWREERSEGAIPVPLNEALTQHFTEVVEPSAGCLLGAERLADGRIRLLVPGRERADTGASIEAVPAPTVYGEGVRVVRMLEARVGREALLEYYRTGDPSPVRAELADQLGRAAWHRIVDAVTSEDWPRARSLLQ